MIDIYFWQGRSCGWNSDGLIQSDSYRSVVFIVFLLFRPRLVIPYWSLLCDTITLILILWTQNLIFQVHFFFVLVLVGSSFSSDARRKCNFWVCVYLQSIFLEMAYRLKHAVIRNVFLKVFFFWGGCIEMFLMHRLTVVWLIELFQHSPEIFRGTNWYFMMLDYCERGRHEAILHWIGRWCIEVRSSAGF